MDRPQNKNLKRGGPGRPKGSKDRRTLAISEFARSILESDEYRASLRARIIAGKAGVIESILFFYGYGKPAEKIQVVDITKPTTFNIGIVPQLDRQETIIEPVESPWPNIKPKDHEQDR